MHPVRRREIDISGKIKRSTEFLCFNSGCEYGSGWNSDYLKGVKKVCSAINLCSYYFSYNVSNDINVPGTL